MTWPQFYGPDDWPVAIAETYGLPSMWLLDKNGIVVTKDAYRNLPAAVERLLAR